MDLPPHAVIRPLTVADLDQVVRLEELGFPPEERCSREKAMYRLRVCPELCAGVFIREYHDNKSTGTVSKTSEEDKELQQDEKEVINDKTAKDQTERNFDALDEEDKFMPPAKSALKSELLIAQIIATKMKTPLVTDTAMEVPAKITDESKVGHMGYEVDEKGHHEDGRTIGIHSLVVGPDFREMHVGTTLMRDYIQRITTQHVADRISLIAHEKLVPFYTRLGFFNEGHSKVQFGGGGWNDLWIPLSQTDDDDEEDEDY